MSQYDGHFIVIEGLDGVGTTTHTEHLSEWLRSQSWKVLTTHEPSARQVGRLLRQYLEGDLDVPQSDSADDISRDFMALLFAADRLEHVYDEIVPALRDDKIVISDRYYHSSFVYQGELSDGDFRTDWVERLNCRAISPDLTVFLDAPVETCFERMSSDNRRDIYEKKALLQKLLPRYRTVMKRRKKMGESIEVIDADRQMEYVADDIQREVKAYLVE